ncbi:MAG: helix-turn-helix transcriptional regulator [Bacteroidetes bacterium]|nr:helix-turn-helix transcriptional regulator [Bacteroidota bacterium]
MNNLGDTIKKFRELKNITRETIAAELKMSLSNYSKIERGEIDLTISRIQEIANILEIDMSQILNFDATNIFNISNNKLVQGVRVETMQVHNDEYKDKYIKILEEEVERLKKMIKS